MQALRPIDAPKFAYNGGKANIRRFIVRWLSLSGCHYVETMPETEVEEPETPWSLSRK